MTIPLELSSEQERRLKAGAARQAKASELAALLDKIAAGFQDAPVLSDEALSREGICGDHP